ncbi:SIR2 family protein [Sulfitobacter sp. JB4-11]|uniref:SIR2 family protein n=1 Tax=Sulfitobacter rhodophyticola TaxID=3238304 RepID=UPI00351603D2
MGDSERRNVIVVGAGASQEFGLPTGAQLAEILQSDLNYLFDDFGTLRGSSGDSHLTRALKQFSIECEVRPEVLMNIGAQISRNMILAPSIDNYLDTHRTNPELVSVGKIAIANAIAKAERSSSLNIDTSNTRNRVNFHRTLDSWVAVFFKICATKRDFEAFVRTLLNTTFVSFNYDRCVKQFFLNAAISYFDLDNVGANRVSDAIEVLHPYGSIGEIEIEFDRTKGFGFEPYPSHIIAASKRIRTFTEGVSDNLISNTIRKTVGNAEVLIFLGFSFIDINMQAIVPKNGNAQRILATAKGRSNDTKSRLQSQLATQFTRSGSTADVEMFDGKCFELFYEFDHFLINSQP